jgi:hypothetical protein
MQGRAGRHRMHDGAHDVVIQLARLQGREGLLGQGLGLGADLDGMGQDRVRPVGLAVQQDGDPFQQQGRCPPGACRAQSGQRRLGVGPHPVDAVAAQQPAHHGQVAGHGAAVWRGLRPYVGVGRWDRVLGGIGPALGPGRPPVQRLQPGPERGHRRVAVNQPVVLEPGQPAADGVGPAGGIGGLSERPQVVGHEPVIPGEREPGTARGAGLAGQRGQIQPRASSATASRQSWFSRAST